MHIFSAAFASQLMLLGFAQAQDMTLNTSLSIWSKDGCSTNANEEGVLAEVLDVYNSGTITDPDTDKKVDDPEDMQLPCSIQHLTIDDWPQDGSGNLKAWLDTSDVPNNCSLLVFMTDTDHNSQLDRNCVSSYLSFSNRKPCASFNVPSTFGYTLCCGSNCGQDPVESIIAPDDDDKNTGKRAQPPRPEDEIIATNPTVTDSNALKSRDVTALKRAAPFNLLNERQDLNARKEKCEFDTDQESGERRKYGKVLQVSPPDNCPPESESNCDITYTISYAEMVGSSFELGASMGANLLEVISFSVSMSVSYQESETDTYSYSKTYSVPPGFTGYITWEPLVECVTGKLKGDCSDKLKLDNDADGTEEEETCFIVESNGIPQGTMGTMRVS
ncbi:hypothetical protein CC79DRAFT_1362036 [Sarocladium strictum]